MFDFHLQLFQICLGRVIAVLEGREDFGLYIGNDFLGVFANGHDLLGLFNGYVVGGHETVAHAHTKAVDQEPVIDEALRCVHEIRRHLLAVVFEQDVDEPAGTAAQNGLVQHAGHLMVRGYGGLGVGPLQIDNFRQKLRKEPLPGPNTTADIAVEGIVPHEQPAHLAGV